MNIKLEMKDFVEEWNGTINKNEIFYRYNIDGNLVWFSQMQDSGNIYSVNVRINEKLKKYFNVWVRCDDNRLFYPNDVQIEIEHSYIKQEDVYRVIDNIRYTNKLCDYIMSIFKLKEHYGLWKENNNK